MWKQIVDVNLLALCIITREAVKLMRGEGYIFHIGTVNGSLNLGPNMGINHLCAATKCGVKMLAENLRMELSRAKSNIKVTVSKTWKLL